MEKAGHSPENETNELLAETMAADISVEHELWNTFEAVTLRLPNDCTIDAMLDFERSDNSRVYNPGFLRINPKLRGHGLGKRLLQASIAYAVDRGATDFHALVVNEQSLSILKNLLGEDSLQYWDYDPKKADKPVRVQANFQEAYDYLDGAKPYESDLEDRSYGIEVYADLQALDTTGWERPTIEAPDETLSAA
jgi:predicted GNAT family acetyltransferase